MLPATSLSLPFPPPPCLSTHHSPPSATISHRLWGDSVGCRHWPCLMVCPSVSAPSLEPPEHPLVLSTLGAHHSPLAPPLREWVPCRRLGEVDRHMGKVSQAFYVCVSFCLCDPKESHKVLKLNFFFRKRTKSLPSLLPLPQSVNPECSFRQQQQDRSQNQTPINSSFHPAPRKGKTGPGCQGQAIHHSRILSGDHILSVL